MEQNGRDASENGLAIIVLFLLFAGASNNAQENSERRQGQLVGSMLYVSGDERSGESLGDAAEVTVELEHKRRIIKLTSNQQGDYILTMAKGKYCLKSAVSADSQPLSFSPHQHRCFQIRPKKDTRFDVMLLKP
jgi:hypothetical protein